MPTYNNISRMKIAPLRQLWLYYPAAPDSPLYKFENLEDGSTVMFTPITVPNDKGGETIVAWEEKISVTILENDYGTKSGLLADFASQKLADVEIILNALDGQQSGAYMYISPDTSPALKVKDWNLLFDVDISSDTPRLNISITGLMSVELFQSAAFVEALFNEGAGY